MLSRLTIRNYALIEDLDISFSEKLNIVTGETGAGKSIILGALSLILGQRIESKYFYSQHKKCVIEGVFRVSGYDLHSFFEEKDLDEEEETLLRREISADGKSRAFINDTPVNLGVLRELGERLIDIHSQHATLEINDEGFQRLVVDSMAANETLLKSYQAQFRNYKKALARLRELEEQNRQAKNDLDYYQFQLNELESAALKAGEQDELEKEMTALSHAEEIKRNLLAASYILTNNDQAVTAQLKEALSQLQHIEKFFSKVSPLIERLQSTSIEIKDIAEEIETQEQNTLVDEGRLTEIGERLDLLYALQKKHRVTTIAELIAIREGFAEKLEAISMAEGELDSLKTQIGTLQSDLIVLSETLSASRNEVIPSVEENIQSILTEVGMPYAVLKIENELLGEDEMNEYGRNRIQFLFSANKGQDPAPMNKVASGGELSRLMLAIKSLISRHIALPTIIFDEIDTGISGEVAFKVGNLMEKLAESMQVITITHLPQIASKGSAHYYVYKEEKEEVTHTNITLLKEGERVMEIAKMLSGENPGEFALQHAREMLAGES